jgi:hypothetical protein
VHRGAGGLGTNGLAIDSTEHEVGVVCSEAVVLMNRPVWHGRACEEGSGCMGRA